MSDASQDLLPAAEFRQLESFVGETLAAVRFCGMRDSDEQFLQPNPSGLHELTFAVILESGSATSLCVSWEQDSFGNPSRLCVTDADTVVAYESAVVQDVSRIGPWSKLIGTPCLNVRPYSYRSNYARNPTSRTWHDVLWGLEFIFEPQTFLVAAAWHGHALDHPLVNDELVVAYSPKAIGQLVALRDGYEENWAS